MVDITELIELARHEVATEKTEYLDASKMSAVRRSAVNFVKHHKVERGAQRCPLYILYHRYRQWCLYVNYPYCSPIEMGRILTKIYDKGKSGKHAYYLVNVKWHKLPRKRKNKIKKWYKKIMDEKRNGKKEEKA